MANKGCTKCNKIKPEEDFYFRSGRQKNERRCICKTCHYVQSSAWYQKNIQNVKHHYRTVTKLKYDKNLRRENHLAKSYGITIGEYKSLLSSQNHKCLICGIDDSISSLKIDHCHSTGAIRGLLCDLCNRGLGMFKDNKYNLERAIDYLSGELKHASQ